jgi:hypothetical protein
MPPLNLVKSLMGVPLTLSISVAAKIGIADILKDGAKTCEDVAQATGVNPQALYRLMRMLVAIGLLTEADGRHFNLTPHGRYLQADHPGSLRDLAIMVGEKWHLRPWTDLFESVRTGEPAFNRLYGMGFFQYLSENPQAASLFGRAMHIMVDRFAAAVAAACDLRGVSCVVDVGGGHGTLLAEILLRHSGVRGVLFDAHAVIDGGAKHLELLGISSRCAKVAGDFFESVPEGGDVYILSRVLHDWDDDRAVTILRNCRRAMGQSGRILVVEVVVGPSPSFYASWLDLEMLVNFGGRERTEAEYGQLFERAGLRVVKVVPTNSPFSVIEGVAQS